MKILNRHKKNLNGTQTEKNIKKIMPNHIIIKFAYGKICKPKENGAAPKKLLS